MPRPWFKIWKEARNDAKLRALTDAQHRVWFNLLCYAAERDDLQASFPYTEEDEDLVALEVAGGDVDAFRSTLAALVRFRMVTLSDGRLCFTKFEERQRLAPSDKPDAIRERVARSRKRKQGDVTTGNVLHAIRNGREEEGDKEEESDSESLTDSGTKERDARAPQKTLTTMQRDYTPIPKPTKSTGARDRKRPPPESILVSAEMREWAAARVPEVEDLDAATERWLDHCRREEVTSADWAASWREGMRWAQRFVLEDRRRAIDDERTQRTKGNGNGNNGARRKSGAEERQDATVAYFEGVAEREAQRRRSATDHQAGGDRELDRPRLLRSPSAPPGRQGA